MAERQFQHNTLDNKIKTAISLTEKLKDYLNEEDYNYKDDINWLNINGSPISLLAEKYNFNSMCTLWSKYIVESIELEFLINESGDIDKSALKDNYICDIREIVSIKIPDKLRLFIEIISLIHDIEIQDYSLANIPKVMFTSIIHSDARYWLYHILIDEQNETLDDYILFQWDDFISYPKDILDIL